MVQKLVVGGVDEELGTGAVDLRGPGHGDGAGFVSELVVRFVFDRFASRLFRQVRGQAATLNHEFLDHPMKNGAIVVACPSVGDKVGHGNGRLGSVQFKNDLAHGCFHLDQGIRGAHGGTPYRIR